MAYIEKTADRYWGFAYLRPRTEKKVAEKLAGLNFPVYLPLVNKARLHHGTKIVTPFPMIPGYIFLAAGDLERTELKKHEKEFVQIELLREKSEEETLIRELNALHQFEILAQTEEVHVNPGIQHGDKVVITQGALKGLETEVIRREDQKNAIVINITILEKTVEYLVPADMLKKLTAQIMVTTAKQISQDKAGREVLYFDVPEKTGIVSVIVAEPISAQIWSSI